MPSQPLNNAKGSLKEDHLAGSDTLVLQDGEGDRFGEPTVDSPVRVTVARLPTLVSGRLEPETIQTIYLATGRTGDTLTGLTAVEETTDRKYYRNDPVQALVTAGLLNEIIESSGGSPFAVLTTNEYDDPSWLVGVDAAKVAGTLDPANLPESGVTPVTTGIPVSATVDQYGRLTSLVGDPNLYWDPTAKQQKLIGQATGFGGDRHNIQTSAGGDLIKVDADGVQWHDMSNVSLADGLVRRTKYKDPTAPYTWNEVMGSFINDPAATDNIPNNVWSAGHNINCAAGQLNPSYRTARFGLESHWWFPGGSRFQSEGHWHAVWDSAWGKELRPLETLIIEQPTLAKAAEIGFNASTWTMNAETGTNIASIRYDPALMTTESELYNSGASVWGVASGAIADTAGLGRSDKNVQFNLNGKIAAMAMTAGGVTYWQWLSQNVPGNTSMALRGQYGNLGYYFQSTTPASSQVRYAAKVAAGGDFSPLAAVHAKPPIDFYPCAIFQRATSQSVDMIRWLSDDGTTLFGRVTKNGYQTWKKTTAIADADLAASEFTTWLDPTPGSVAIRYRAKDSAGTAATPGIVAGRITTPGRDGPITANTDAATVTFDLAASDKHTLTMNVAGANRTLALSNESASGQDFRLYLTQLDGTQTVTWWSGIRWINGTPPVLSATAGAMDVIVISKLGSGSYAGFHAGPNMS